MIKLEIGQAILTCRGNRYTRVEYSIPRGEFEKDFPSILAAIDWCKSNNLKIIG